MSDKYKFLDLLEKKLDSAQNAALETVNNSVIAAGAGSGKTQVLATRFAWLVMTGQAKADEILTLTFTNKAASEMYQRIYETLDFFANHEICEELTENQRKLAKEGLSDFANAHIQTLDSYCSNIVRQCSNRYGISPDFSAGSSECESDIKARTFKYVLTNAKRPGIQAFADAGKLQEFATKTLTPAINKYANITTPDGYFSSKLPVQVKTVTETLNFYFADKDRTNPKIPGKINLHKIVDLINSEFKANYNPSKNKEYKEAVEKVLAQLPDALFETKFTENDIITNNKTLSDAQTMFNGFIHALNTTEGLTRGKIKGVHELLKVIKDSISPACDSLFAFINQYEALKDLYSIFDELLEEVNSAKRVSGNLSFTDVSELALKILIENPDIRQQENNAYKKIMIDEFQDNNGNNRDLLYILSLKEDAELDISKPVYSQIIIKDNDGTIIKDNRQPEKLFFVGDEKQSIYKFRGADVSVFNELTSHGENALIPMSYNYRSTPEVISAFNILFANEAGIFDSESNSYDYEAYYRNPAMKNNTELPALNAENVPFHFCLVDTKNLTGMNEGIKNPAFKALPADDQIGYYIAKKIKEMAGTEKKWSNFAILDKNRTHRSSITKFLSYFNIPYEMDQFSNIFEDGIINDIYNFLRICVYPSDINAYSAYLCSPLCGLSENAVEIILSHLTNSSDYDFVFDPLADFDEEIQKDLKAFSSNQFEKYVNARNFFKENKKLTLQQNLTTTIDFLWNKLGYKYETMLNQQLDLCSEHFDMIFELARNCDENNKSVAWFIDELENLKSTWSSNDADIDAGSVSYPLERSEAVQIMTIHKSKGLQFEHVFLCGCTDVRANANKSTIYYDDENGVSVCAEKGVKNYFSYCQSELEKRKELAEFRRLIYVGITRAIQDVYVMGKWNPGSDSDSILHLFEELTKKTYKNELSKPYFYTPEKAFDYTNLQPVTYSDIASISSSESLEQTRKQLIRNVASVLQNAETITYTSNAIPRSCPSALETSYFSESESEDALKDNLRQENKDEAYLRSEGFTAADFGTLVHAYLEAQSNGISPEEFQPASKLFKNLDDEKILAEKTACIKFCKDFLQTDMGKELTSAKENNRFYRSEWAFKMFWDNTIWTGSIDLIYENADGTYTIVDYKSDNKVDASKYAGQQNCYRTAAAKMLKIDESKIDCKLWFMKSNTVISPEPCDHQ